jgi:hypothetical protein
MKSDQPEGRALAPMVGGLAGAAGSVILLVFALFALVHYAIFGLLAAFVIVRLAKAKRWPGEWRLLQQWWIAIWGLMAYLFVTWILDLIFKNHYSVIGVLAAVDRYACYPDCSGIPSPYNTPRIGGFADYYAFAVGGPLGWIKYLLFQIPGAVACVYAVIMSMPFNIAGHPGGMRRVVTAALITLAVELVLGIPLLVEFILVLTLDGQ